MVEWAQENPFYLLIVDSESNVEIDLDEPNWMSKYRDLAGKDWLRIPSKWYLCLRSDKTVKLAMVVHEGDQPYYTARHIGIASIVQNSETIAYGIGKKKANGETHRLWFMLSGGYVVCDEDCDILGVDLIHMLNPPPLPEEAPTA